jgi:hypothetical protein
MSGASMMTSAHRLALAQAAFAALALLVLGCGDDAPPPGAQTGNPRDSGTDAGPDAMTPRDSSMQDARPDTGGSGGSGGGGGSGGTEPPPPPDEDAGTCDEDCAELSNECVTGVCNDTTLECEIVAKPDGTECGDQATTDCSARDTCEAGVCEAHHASAGQACGDQGDACKRDDACNEQGECEDKGLRPVGTECGDQLTDTECDAADTCDASGECNDNFAPLEAPCGDQDAPCRDDDQCNGAGACIDQGEWEVGNCPAGVEESPRGDGRCVCGNPDAPLSECRPGPDVCDDDGACIPGDEFYGGEEGTDGLPCGDDTSDTECDDPDRCLDGECLPNNEPLDTPCGDRVTNTVCDGRDACNGFGQCDDHLADVITVCGDAPGVCFNEPLCNGSGQCLAASGASAGTMCGSQTVSECDGANVCDGFGGCEEAYVAEEAECGPEVTSVCDAVDQCNGSGACVPRFADTDVTCGDETECSNAQTCDGAGGCEPDPKPAGEPCTGEVSECQDGAECDGEGACAPNYEPEFTECGAPAVTCEQQDSCDATGVCQDRGAVSDCDLATTIVVELEAEDADDQPAEGVLIEVMGSDPLQSGVTDANGEVVLTLPAGERVLLRIHATATTWGSVEPVRVRPEEPLLGFEILDDVLFASSVQAAGVAPVDTARGALQIEFNDVSYAGGESAALSPSCAAASCGPVVLADNEPVRSDELLPDSDEMFYLSLLPGDYALTPVGANGDTCALDASNPSPVFAHTVTRVSVSCTPD